MMDKDVQRLRQIFTSLYLKENSKQSFDALDSLAFSRLSKQFKDRPRFLYRVSQGQRIGQIAGDVDLESFFDSLNAPEFGFPGFVYTSSLWTALDYGPESLDRTHHQIAEELSRSSYCYADIQHVANCCSYNYVSRFGGLVTTRSEPEFRLYNLGVVDIAAASNIPLIPKLGILALLMQEAMLLRSMPHMNLIRESAKALLPVVGSMFDEVGRSIADLYSTRVLDWLTAARHWQCAEFNPVKSNQCFVPIFTDRVRLELKEMADAKTRDFTAIRELLNKGVPIPADDRHLQYAYRSYCKEFNCQSPFT